MYALGSIINAVPIFMHSDVCSNKTRSPQTPAGWLYVYTTVWGTKSLFVALLWQRNVCCSNLAAQTTFRNNYQANPAFSSSWLAAMAWGHPNSSPVSTLSIRVTTKQYEWHTDTEMSLVWQNWWSGLTFMSKTFVSF
jgi:hypothetical protein